MVNDLSIVTAADAKYIDYLSICLPTWYARKGAADLAEVIVFIHGIPMDDARLDFIKAYDNTRIVAWEWPGLETHRELMLSAFVLGAAREVVSDFWVKLDAEVAATNDDDWVPDDFRDFDLLSRGWGYTNPIPGGTCPEHTMRKIDYFLAGHGIIPRIERVQHTKGKKKGEWKTVDLIEKYYKDARKRRAKSPDFKPGKARKHLEPRVSDDGSRWLEGRIISWICFHKSSFIREVAAACGDRMIVASHDTLCWRYAQKAGLKWGTRRFGGWAHGKKGLEKWKI